MKKEKQLVSPPYKDYSATTTSSAYSYENFAVTDDPDGLSYKASMNKLNGRSESKKKLHKINSPFSDKTFAGISDRMYESKTTSFGYPSVYGTHDRKENNSHRFSQTQPSPDFYFMPHQRKYSGDVVRVHVDYNKKPN